MRVSKCSIVLILGFASTCFAQQPTWTLFTPSGFGPRGGGGSQSTAYDAATDSLIVFGGYNPTASGETNDVWVLMNASGTGALPTWRQVIPNAPAGLPATRQAHSAVYDPATNRLIVFGGGQAGGGAFSSLFQDVWVLTFANNVGGTPQWIPLTPSGGPPAPREGHAAVYNQATNEMFVFGGGNNGIMSVPNDLWVLEAANGIGTPTWIQLSETGNVPGRLENFASAYDQASNRWTVVGGCCFYTNASEVLALNQPTGVPQWTSLSPSGTLPPGGDAAVYGYDSVSDRMIVHGIQPGGGGNATWLLTNSNAVGATPAWINLIPEGALGSPTEGVNRVGSAYNPRTKKLIHAVTLLDAQGNLVPELWVLSNADGTGGSSAPPPSINSISVSSVIQGQSITNVIVNGNGFQPGATLSFGGDGGVNVDSSTVTATQIIANLSIAIVAATGPRDVTVANPDGQKTSLSAAFTVNGTSPPLLPAITVSPTSIDFGTVYPGRPATMQTITVSNSGTAPLFLTGITSSNPAFTFSAATMGPIVPQGSSTIAVGVSPSPGTIGTIKSVLTIAGNAPPSSIVMTGTSATSNGPLLLLPIDSPLPSPPLDIQPINNHQVGNTIVTDFIIRNLTGTWYEVTLDPIGANGPPRNAPIWLNPAPQKVPISFVIAPRQLLRFPQDGTDLTFSAGQYLQFRATDKSNKAALLFSVDMFVRGFFGTPLIDPNTFTTALSQIISLSGLDKCATDATNVVIDVQNNDPAQAAWDTAGFIGCVAGDPTLVPIITDILQKTLGSNTANKWTVLAPSLSKVSIALSYGTNFFDLMVPLAYAQLTAQSPAYLLLEVPLPGRSP